MSASSPQSPLHIFVDVDDTLVRSVGSKRIPIPAVVQHVCDLHAQGAILYCWSAGGAEYARRTAEDLGLAHCFVAFLPKPNVLIDDQSAADWPRCIAVHPTACAGITIDAYRERVR